MRFIQELPKQFKDKNSQNSAKAMFMDAIKKGSKKPQQSHDERYQKIYKDKLSEVRNNAMKGAKYTFNLPGTDPSEAQQLSKGAQEIIAKIAEKKAKREEKKLKRADVVKVTPKYFMGPQGGRIDSKGYIFDSAGQWIMTVDKKTGKIKNRRNGCTVGKYNPNDNFSEHRLTELIAQHDTTKQNGWYAGSQGHGSSTPADSVWGKESGSVGTGSIWGGDSGGFWGGGNDDKKSGWW